MNAPLDDDEVDTVHLNVDGNAADVDETVLLDMIALDHLSRAAQTIKC